MSGRYIIGFGVCSLVLIACADHRDDAPAGRVAQRMTFGADDRSDVADAEPRHAQWAESIGLIGPENEMCQSGSPAGVCRINSRPATERILPASEFGLCPEQPFAEQRVVDLSVACSAFYVGGNRFITASHCLRPQTSSPLQCDDTAVLMGWTEGPDGSLPEEVSTASHLYHCSEIVSWELALPGKHEWTVFEVEEEVVGHRALRIRRNLEPGPVTGTSLVMVGHGNGLPSKSYLAGEVENTANAGFFYHTLDNMGVDSGSPLFNPLDGVVEGLLVAGPLNIEADWDLEQRFDDDGNLTECWVYRIPTCADEGCDGAASDERWATATRTTLFPLSNAVPELPETPLEHVTILLDQTGSMTLDGTADGLMRWDDAINAASFWVQLDSAAPFFGRAYSVWTFKKDAEQEGALQIWPRRDSTDCPNYDESTGYCVFDSSSSSEDYDLVLERLESIRESHRPVTGPSTPLAQSLCDVVESLTTINTLKRFILESDGGENATALFHGCRGFDSDPFGAWDISLPDWGMSLDSWQAKVIRRATRLDQTIADAIVDPLSALDGFPADLSWLVDVHYAISEPATISLLSTASSDSAHATSLALEDAASADVPGSLTFAAASDSPGAILQADLDFFRNLGAAAADSQVREFVRAEGATYGVAHVIAGDVDDSGCVDHADYAIIRQGDVWMQRAVLPLEIAVRADVNRDGWVNFGDLMLVVSEWGSGCFNPPSPPANCSDGRRNLDETDVDCGGACERCAEGLSCSVDEDCQTEVCTDGTCGPAAPPAFDVCECRPTKCADCGSQVAACEATPGCVAVVSCVFHHPCQFPHENCEAGQSCYQIVGYPQNSPAGQAANQLIACFGGC